MTRPVIKERKKDGAHRQGGKQWEGETERGLTGDKRGREDRQRQGEEQGGGGGRGRRRDGWEDERLSSMEEC